MYETNVDTVFRIIKNNFSFSNKDSNKTDSSLS